MITQQQPISYATPVHTKVPRNIFIIGVVLIFTGDLTLGLSVSIFGELQIKWVPINQHGLSVLISVWIVVTGVLALYICRNSQSQRLVAIYRIIAMIGVILTFIAAVASAVGFVDTLQQESLLWNYCARSSLCPALLANSILNSSRCVWVRARPTRATSKSANFPNCAATNCTTN
ncbi:uncharacterized protein LOC130627509 isoform X2 [Hydractinia symbiolongicarpus]|uniref:uncharacterized protein LOC130627509 isoform X2 n=1 Tax=Hydractinia symbiolongicarpus TaxID=13093 RepID=UPI00254F5931|nr:uncharacterized protein LOC130627509 isoform X2 [Hydractinia symbiolongicarpus]